MEEKVVVAAILRRLWVESKLRTDQMRVAAELIIRPMYGNHIRFHRRNFGDYWAQQKTNTRWSSLLSQMGISKHIYPVNQ